MKGFRVGNDTCAYRTQLLYIGVRMTPIRLLTTPCKISVIISLLWCFSVTPMYVYIDGKIGVEYDTTGFCVSLTMSVCTVMPS
jgi:hypothetical protein